MAWRCGGRSEVTWLSVWWFPFVASLVRTQVQMVVYGLGLSHYTRDMLMGSHVVSCVHGFIHVVSCVHGFIHVVSCIHVFIHVVSCVHGFIPCGFMSSWVHTCGFVCSWVHTCGFMCSCHVVMGSCMHAWVQAWHGHVFMGSCHVFWYIGSCSHVVTGSCIDGYKRPSLHGFMGSWVEGFMGQWGGVVVKCVLCVLFFSQVFFFLPGDGQIPVVAGKQLNQCPLNDCCQFLSWSSVVVKHFCCRCFFSLCPIFQLVDLKGFATMPRLLKLLSDDPDLVQKYVAAFKKEEKLFKALLVGIHQSSAFSS